MSIYCQISCKLATVSGFENVSTLPDTAYRGRMFPGLGFLIKKSFYTDTLKAQMSSCCHKRFPFSLICNLTRLDLGSLRAFPLHYISKVSSAVFTYLLKCSNGSNTVCT